MEFKMTDTTTTSRTKKSLIAATALMVVGSFAMTAGAEAFGGKGGERGGRGGPMGAVLMQGIDADQNGTVTEAEVGARLGELFATVDADSNGSVTMEELKQARETLQATMQERRGDRGERGERSKRGERFAKRGERRMERSFARADADDNGAVSLEEFQTATATHLDNIAERANRFQERRQARFDALDTNGDGVVSAEEFATGRGSRR